MPPKLYGMVELSMGFCDSDDDWWSEEDVKVLHFPTHMPKFISL